MQKAKNPNLNDNGTPRVGRPKGPQKDFAEIGHTGLRASNGYVREEFLNSLLGPKGVKVFREMRDNDPVVAAMLFAVERVIMQAHWEVIAGGNEKVDIDAANFVKSCMEDMTHTWEDFMSEIISMLPYGWAAFEVVYKVRKHSTNEKLNDRRIGWKKFGFRGQDTLSKWELGIHGEINGMYQSTLPDFVERYISMEKMLLFRTKSEKNNPEGRSILRGAYRSWFFKKTLEEIEAIGVERDLVGLPVLTPPEDFDLDDPENSEVKTWAKNVITSIRRDEQEGVLLPPGWKLELQGSPGKRQFDTNEIIARYNRLIAMTMLAQFLMLGMEKGGGSYALSENQSDLFMLSIIGWMNSITETVNRFAIQKLLDMNPEFENLKNPPKVQPIRVTPPDLDTLSNYIFKLARVGMMAPDEDLVKSLRSMALLVESPQSREIKVKTPEEGNESLMANIIANQERTMKPGGAAGDKSKSTAGKATKKDFEDDSETPITREEMSQLIKNMFSELKQPDITVNVDNKTPEVNVNVEKTEVNIEPAEVTNNITVEKDEAPKPPSVNKTVFIERDAEGNIESLKVEKDEEDETESKENE